MALACARAVSVATALAFTALVAAGVASSAPLGTPAAVCSTSPYAYAGLAGNSPTRGIKATVTTLAESQVTSGHVAGWIGLGGVDAGPGNQPEWIQTGVNTMAGGGSELYLEITRPGTGTTYQTLKAGIVAGSHYSLAIVRLDGHPNVWQATLDGKTAGQPVYLPASGGFEPMAMSESWNGGTPSCNGFAYHFDHLQVASPLGAWGSLTGASTLADTGYRLTDRTASGFTALSA